jgi:hypothetical protein
MRQDVTLVVSSCDIYEDAWYPYFELIKKYWPEHPENIVLITETKSFSCDGLNVKVFNYDEHLTWSERLYRTLEAIPTKYIIFSLEDFFLLDYVKQQRIDECYDWMEADPQIAVCRLVPSDNLDLKPAEQYKDFYIADNSVAFRLDTQMALWNRETLMSFIDLSESPWAFEEIGTQRIMDTDKIFLWHHSDDLKNRENDIVCYRLIDDGLGLSWGYWLWENKKWFKQNRIKGVKFYRLGVLSKRTVELRCNYFYTKCSSRFVKIIKPLWTLITRVRHFKGLVLTIGFRRAINKKIG